jgi:hypothetical protein
VFRIFIALGLSIATAPQAAAEALVAVNLEVQLPAEMAIRPPDPQKVATMNALSATLAQHLKEMFPYWDFQPAPAPGVLPSLQIAVFGGTPDIPTVFARLSLKRKLVNQLREDSLGPDLPVFGFKEYGDLLDDANWKPLFEQVGRKFRGELIRARPNVLKDLKEILHVGTGTIPASVPDTDVVLPLPWESFAAYSKSRFKIHCINPAGAILVCEAIGQRYLRPMPKGFFVWVRGDEIKLPGAAVLKVAAMPLEELKGLQLKFGEILLETEVENPEADVSDPEAAVNTSS